MTVTDIYFKPTKAAAFERMELINPVEYAKTRNFYSGKVSMLSPYISRGVLSTSTIAKFLLKKSFSFSEIEKFIQELSWRDYWQLKFEQLGLGILKDLNGANRSFRHTGLPVFLENKSSGIDGIDQQLELVQQTGYMHNHARMYTASLVCNIYGFHWLEPAKWMYYHLIDADPASNMLSWQWVAGTASHKQYFANQENINKYAGTGQKNTLLDSSYDELEKLVASTEIKGNLSFHFNTELPDLKGLVINKNLPTLLFHPFHIDKDWKSELDANRILLLEPKMFELFPMCRRTVQFICDLASEIKDIQIFTGNFEDIYPQISGNTIFSVSHPLCNYSNVVLEPRSFICSYKENPTSFFNYWKLVKKEILR